MKTTRLTTRQRDVLVRLSEEGNRTIMARENEQGAELVHGVPGLIEGMVLTLCVRTLKYKRLLEHRGTAGVNNVYRISNKGRKVLAYNTEKRAIS